MFKWITTGLFALALAVGSASMVSAAGITGGCCDSKDKSCKKECCKDACGSCGSKKGDKK